MRRQSNRTQITCATCSTVFYDYPANRNEYSVTQGMVSLIVSGKNWRHVP